MELSIYLAKFIGIYLLVVAADMLLRRHEIRGAIKDFASSKGLLVFSGSISLLMGLAIVIAHPVYEQSLQGLITLLGYLLILRGVWRMAFPTHVQKRLASLVHRGYWTIFIILLVLGYYLTYTGFNAI